MAKTDFVCRNCQYSTPRWMGKCPQCGEWNTFLEKIQTPARTKRLSSSVAQPIRLSDVTALELETDRRIPGPLGEVDRVLGGGIVEGSLILLSGDPGIGKSTLLLNLAGGLALLGKNVLYGSSEESLHQLLLRIQRLRIKRNESLFLLSTDRYSDIAQATETTAPQVVVVDSIQNLFHEELDYLPGSVALIRDLSVRFMEMAKRKNVAVVLVGHVTKEGVVAGPRTLEHLVDVVLYLEGEPQSPLRMLRSVKNRFGSTQEVGLLEMKDEGLVELADPGQYFIAEGHASDSGNARTVIVEGKRALLIEVQSLVNPSYLDVPRRVSLGIDLNRLQLLVAVLEKRARVKFAAQDIYLNVVGGLRVTETVTDLAVCFSLASSRLERKTDPRTVYLGEVGLSGEIRPGYMLGSRIQEAFRNGVKRVVCSEYSLGNQASAFPQSLEIVRYKNVVEALIGENIL
ncbi:MAG TPA: DNA repair protein RadA [Atribacteraceae bacterium]|nr:DNA repair protein RadA [Atribacteraceae bacterium]